MIVSVCVVFFPLCSYAASERKPHAELRARALDPRIRCDRTVRRDAKTATMRKTYFTHAHVRPAYKRGRVSSASVGREYHVWVEMEVDMRTRVHHTCVGGASECECGYGSSGQTPFHESFDCSSIMEKRKNY